MDTELSKKIDEGIVVGRLNVTDKIPIDNGSNLPNVCTIEQILYKVFDSEEFTNKADSTEVSALANILTEMIGTISESAIMRLGKLLEVFEEAGVLDEAIDKLGDTVASEVAKQIAGFRITMKQDFRTINGASLFGKSDMEITPKSIGAATTSELQQTANGIEARLTQLLKDQETGKTLQQVTSELRAQATKISASVKTIEDNYVSTSTIEVLQNAIRAVVEEDGRVKAGVIINAINEDSEATILADKIKFDGDVLFTRTVTSGDDAYMVSLGAKEIVMSDVDKNHVTYVYQDKVVQENEILGDKYVCTMGTTPDGSEADFILRVGEDEHRLSHKADTQYVNDELTKVNDAIAKLSKRVTNLANQFSTVVDKELDFDKVVEGEVVPGTPVPST